MADQPINGLPKKTAAADTDALLMIGASEEYQIDYGKLADAILNKLTNKTFALDQGSKSLVAALNELNSKTVSYTTYKPINPSKGFLAELDNGCTYLVVYASLDNDNIRNVAFSIIISRISNSVKGGILNISNMSNIELTLEGNIFKIITPIWLRVALIKL